MSWIRPLLQRSTVLMLLLSTTVACRAQNADLSGVPHAVLRISSTRPAVLDPDPAPLPPAEYSRLVETQIALLKTDQVLGQVVRDPKVVSASGVGKLSPKDIDRLREALVIEHSPKDELVTVRLKADAFPPENAIPIINSVVDSYMMNVVAKERKRRNDRLDTLRKLWDGYQFDLKTRRASLRALAEASGALDREFHAVTFDILSKRISADSLKLDELSTQREALKVQHQRLQSRKNPSPAVQERIEDIGDQLAVCEAQIELLSKRLREDRDELRATSRDKSLDVTQEQEEMAVATETARKIGLEIERLEVEHQAPEIVTVIQQASRTEAP